MKHKELKEQFKRDFGLEEMGVYITQYSEWLEEKLIDSHKSDEVISAFAFNIGRTIEKLIQEQTENLEDKNRITEAKILQWYTKTKDEEFAEHFGIVTMCEGSV